MVPEDCRLTWSLVSDAVSVVAVAVASFTAVQLGDARKLPMVVQ